MGFLALSNLFGKLGKILQGRMRRIREMQISYKERMIRLPRPLWVGSVIACIAAGIFVAIAVNVLTDGFLARLSCHATPTGGPRPRSFWDWVRGRCPSVGAGCICAPIGSATSWGASPSAWRGSAWASVSWKRGGGGPDEVTR